MEMLFKTQLRLNLIMCGCTRTTTPAALYDFSSLQTALREETFNSTSQQQEYTMGTAILYHDLTIGTGEVLDIDGGRDLQIQQGVTLTIDGTINIKKSDKDVNGYGAVKTRKIINKGTIIVNGQLNVISGELDNDATGEITNDGMITSDLGVITNNGTITNKNLGTIKTKNGGIVDYEENYTKVYLDVVSIVLDNTNYSQNSNQTTVTLTYTATDELYQKININDTVTIAGDTNSEVNKEHTITVGNYSTDGSLQFMISEDISGTGDANEAFLELKQSNIQAKRSKIINNNILNNEGVIEIEEFSVIENHFANSVYGKIENKATGTINIYGRLNSWSIIENKGLIEIFETDSTRETYLNNVYDILPWQPESGGQDSDYVNYYKNGKWQTEDNSNYGRRTMMWASNSRLQNQKYSGKGGEALIINTNGTIKVNDVGALFAGTSINTGVFVNSPYRMAVEGESEKNYVSQNLEVVKIDSGTTGKVIDYRYYIPTGERTFYGARSLDGDGNPTTSSYWIGDWKYYPPSNINPTEAQDASLDATTNIAITFADYDRDLRTEEGANETYINNDLIPSSASGLTGYNVTISGPSGANAPTWLQIQKQNFEYHKLIANPDNSVATGEYPVTVSVTDPDNLTRTSDITINVLGAPSISGIVNGSGVPSESNPLDFVELIIPFSTSVYTDSDGGTTISEKLKTVSKNGNGIYNQYILEISTGDSANTFITPLEITRFNDTYDFYKRQQYEGGPGWNWLDYDELVADGWFDNTADLNSQKIDKNTQWMDLQTAITNYNLIINSESSTSQEKADAEQQKATAEAEATKLDNEKTALQMEIEQIDFYIGYNKVQIETVSDENKLRIIGEFNSNGPMHSSKYRGGRDVNGIANAIKNYKVRFQLENSTGGKRDVILNLRVNPWLENIGDFPTDIPEGPEFSFEFQLNPDYKKWLEIYNDATSTTNKITENGISNIAITGAGYNESTWYFDFE